MNPKPINSQLGITVEFIEDINSLNNLADISHVEHIMGFLRSRQEIIGNCIVDV